MGRSRYGVDGDKLRRFATGCCNYPSTVCIHHVIHMALHFKSELPFVDLSPKAMKQLVRVMGQIRGSLNTGGYITMEGEPNIALTRWVESTPVFKKWLMSPKAFVAPAAWPEDVAKMFRFKGEVPSPYEVSGLRTSPHFRRGRWHTHAVSVLLAYSCGMPIEIMEEGMEVDRKYILADMITGVDNLCAIPQFQLWCWNLDLSLVPLPPLEGYTLNDKLNLHQELQKHPFHVTTPACEALLRAPFFRSYAKLKLLPSQVKLRPAMGTPIVGPPRFRRKNGQKEKPSEKVPTSK